MSLSHNYYVGCTISSRQNTGTKVRCSLKMAKSGTTHGHACMTDPTLQAHLDQRDFAWRTCVRLYGVVRETPVGSCVQTDIGSLVCAVRTCVRTGTYGVRRDTNWTHVARATAKCG